MKMLVAAALIAATGAAHAVDVEIGAGAASYVARGNMMWYQEGLPYTLDLRAPVIEAGLAGNLIQRGQFGLDWHVGYVYMGDARSDSIATSDENYNKQLKSCDGPCDFKSRFSGHGGVQGLRMTIEPIYRHNHWRFGVEAGLFAFRPRWNVTVYNRPGDNGYETTHAFHVKGDTSIRVSPVIGANVGYDNLSIAYSYYMNIGSGAPFHSLWKSAHTVTLRYRF